MTPEQRETTEVLALASDGPELLQTMVDRVEEENDGYVIDFTLLSDPDGAIINRYGLFNQEGPEGTPIPHPTAYVIDRDGRVHWKFTEVNYRVRPENEDILAALAELEGT